MVNHCLRSSSWLALLLLTLCSLFFFVNNAFAFSTLTATLDRNPVMEREPFVLEVTADGSLDRDVLKVSELNSSGLSIGRVSTSSQTQIINGDFSRTTTWRIIITAQKAGQYQIPSFEIDGVRSQPIKLNVVKMTNQKSSTNEPIFLKNTLDKQQLYLQESLSLVTRLYISPQVNLQSGTLSEPELEGAFIKQQGKDKDSSDIVNGIRFRVIERIYSVTPQASGDFTLKPPTFNGEVSVNNRRQSFFNMAQTQPISAFSEDLKIKVLPIPAHYSGTWLPSTLVQLNEEWQPDKNQFEVGEAITRTFTLTALNVNEEQLPDVKGQYPDSFNLYPDQSESHSVLRQNALVSQRVNSEALIANQPGTYTLPEVRLNWFNTKTQQAQVAILPARTIEVLASANASTQSPNQNASLSSNNSKMLANENDHSSNADCPVAEKTITKHNNTVLDSMLLWSGWITWLATLMVGLLLFKSSKLTTHSNQSPPLESPSSQPNYNKSKLKKACQSNESQLARQQLLLWAQNRFTNVITLSELQVLVSAELSQQISLLEQSKYSANKSQWKGAPLWNTLIAFEKSQTKSTKSTSVLPPLN